MLPSSAGASVPPLAAGAKPAHQSSYAQSYVTATSAKQSNNNPILRSAASRSVAGPSVYANVSASIEPPGTTSGRVRMQPSGMQFLLLHL